MPVYPVLTAEIAKRGIKKKEIAKSLGVSERAFCNKLSGVSEFKWSEVEVIRRQYFPDITTDQLFERAE